MESGEGVNKPAVSITPTYNSERTLQDCLESIKHQDYPDVEIIIADGGSTDSTLEIARNYETVTLRVGGN